MCPACLTTLALTTAGGTTLGAISTMAVCRLFKHSKPPSQAAPTPKELKR